LPTLLLIAGCTSPSVTQPKAQKVTTPSLTFSIDQQVSSESAPVIGWKTYNNKKYGFEFKYPGDWKVISEEFKPEATSIWPVILESTGGRYSFGVRITSVPEQFIFDPELRREIELSDQANPAYIFPEGYECYGDEPQDCSIFYVPIKKNDRWYILQGEGGVSDDLLSVYTDILSTFRFTTESAQN